jgi:myosin heavy subunit
MSENTIKGQAKLTFTGTKPQTKQATKKSRPDSETSNSSMDELHTIQTQLQNMTEGITSLRDELKSMLKKEEIEELITSTITTFMAKIEENMNNKIEHIVSSKINEMQSKIDSLEFDNTNLKEKIQKIEDTTTSENKSLQEQVNKAYELSKLAHQKANYNEQYSRKNNIKILNIQENRNESEESLAKTVTSTLKTHTGVDLLLTDIVAIHRIPTKRGKTRPVLIKLKNNSAKSTIMRKRTPMKNNGYQLVDDVTKPNQGLISRLHLHPDISSAWYFNGSVYGQTVADERIKFDIYDNVNNVIEEFRRFRRTGVSGR